jgi:hypothetical protein
LVLAAVIQNQVQRVNDEEEDKKLETVEQHFFLLSEGYRCATPSLLVHGSRLA